MATSNLTAQQLRKLLSYDPLTGVFTRRVSTSHNARAGDIAGSAHPKGYSCISVLGKPFLAHRLAWLYVYDEWPSENIDHRNGDRTDNRIDNLRQLTVMANAENTRQPHRDNKSGYLGVVKRRSKWLAVIQANGKYTRIGLFDTPELAHEAYLAEKRKNHKACTI